MMRQFAKFMFRVSLVLTLTVVSALRAGAQYVLVELNCENLFDTTHDAGKNDYAYTPEGTNHWTRTKYWNKLNNIAREVLSCSDRLPDLVALVEVENDSVLHSLTRRTLLRRASYEFLVTSSTDKRGIDVALLYQPSRFMPLCYDEIRIDTMPGMRPTRDILRVSGVTHGNDTLHIFVVHMPSRYGGELETRKYRNHVAGVIRREVNSLAGGNVIVTGDFNDYSDSQSMLLLEQGSLHNITAGVQGLNGRAQGTYRFRGEWHSIDHVLVSENLLPHVITAYINDSEFLLEKDDTYGGWRPLRSFTGSTRHGGFSDHLPLVVNFSF